MTTVITCPTWQLANVFKTISTFPQLYLASGLGPDKSLPKELTIGEGVAAKHEIIWPGGKRTELSFEASLFDLDDPGVQCLAQYVGFDAKKFETNQDPRSQTTYLAESLHELLSGAKALKEANPGTGTFTYDQLRKVIGDEAETDTAIQVIFAYQGIVHSIKSPQTTLTINDLVQEHYDLAKMSLEKGALICQAVESPKKFYENDQKEYQIVCQKPANLAELAIAADKNVPAGGWKTTPSDFTGAAQQLKVLNLKPANLKEAGQAFEVMPDSPQAVLNVMGYEKYKAIPKTGLIAVVGAALAVGFGLGWVVRNIKASRKIHPNTESAIQKDAIADDGMPRKPEKTKAASETATPAKTTGSAPETRVVSDPFAGAKAPAPATRTVVAPEGDMADLAAALSSAGKDKSPLPGATPSNPPSTTGITADNVIIRGTDARPSAELNKNVVMAEIAYLNPKFLTEDGTAIHSNFKAGVEQLADLAMQAFGNQGANAASPTELWRVEHGKHGSMIRGGLPEGWLREFVGSQLEKWHAAGAPGMSFDVTARETMERDAARRAGERSAYEKWVEDALRDPVRLAGR